MGIFYNIHIGIFYNIQIDDTWFQWSPNSRENVPTWRHAQQIARRSQGLLRHRRASGAGRRGSCGGGLRRLRWDVGMLIYRCYMILYTFIWCYMILFDFRKQKWFYMMVYDFYDVSLWFYMKLYDFIWFHMNLYRFIWFILVNVHDFIWMYMVLYEFIRCF